MQIVDCKHLDVFICLLIRVDYYWVSLSFSLQAYVVGSQTIFFKATVLLSTKHMPRLRHMKIVFALEIFAHLGLSFIPIICWSGAMYVIKINLLQRDYSLILMIWWFCFIVLNLLNNTSHLGSFIKCFVNSMSHLKQFFFYYYFYSLNK